MSGFGKFRETTSCVELRRQFTPQQLEQHLRKCTECAEQTPAIREVRRMVRTLPRPIAPLGLDLKLRVLASREAARRRTRLTVGQLCQGKLADFRLWMNNLMRPLAIPTAGGFASALVLFGVLGISLSFPGATALANSGLSDVPTGLYTEASIKSFMPLGLHEEELIIEITVDDQGRVIDYTLPASQNTTPPALRRDIENYLLFAQFKPATRFLQPTSGKVRLSFRSSRIDVKG